MMRLSQILPILYFTVDVSILVCAFFGATIIINQNGYEGLEWFTLGIVLSLWLIIGFSRKLYHSNLNNGISRRMISYAKSYLIFAFAILCLAYLRLKFPIQFDNILVSFVILFLALNIATNVVL